MEELRATTKFVQSLKSDNYKDFLSRLSEKELDAIMIYTSGEDYQDINNSLRSGQPNEKALILLELFDRLPLFDKDLTVFRAIDTEFAPVEEGDHIFHGFLSTTTDPTLQHAPLDDNSTVMMINIPAHTIPIIPWNEMLEQEILLPSGLRGTVEHDEEEYVIPPLPFGMPEREYPLQIIDVGSYNI